MRRTVAKSNPFRDVPRFAFGYEYIQPGMRVIDYGCMHGEFGIELLKHKDVEYVGVDKNGDVRKTDGPVRIEIIESRIPFDDGTFDVATAFEVIEHVTDQDAMLRELWRVLKPGGLLVVSVPRKNVLSFLDYANWKYVFPRAHRFFFTLRYSEKAYQYRYLENPYGLVGTVEKDKGWHQHFRDGEMRELLTRNRFAVIEMDGAGLLSVIFEIIGMVPPLGRLFTQRIRNWDSDRFHERSLVCAARKA